MAKPKKKTGVQELTDCSVSIQYGCINGCDSYCWAKKIHTRFNRVNPAGWNIPILKAPEELKHLPRNKRVLCFGTHDIDQTNLDSCIYMIERLLDRHNTILIVSKPRLKCIEEITHRFLGHRNAVEFMFTIGSCNNDTIRKWETNSPLYSERLYAMEWTLHNGYKTSVLCEPLLELDCMGKVELIERLLQYQELKEIWIGAMKYTKNAPSLDYLRIYNYYKSNPQIKWKDSFKIHLTTIF